MKQFMKGKCRVFCDQFDDIFLGQVGGMKT